MKFEQLCVGDHFMIAGQSSNGGKFFQKGKGQEARRICFQDGRVVETSELVTVRLEAEVLYANMVPPHVLGGGITSETLGLTGGRMRH